MSDEILDDARIGRLEPSRLSGLRADPDIDEPIRALFRTLYVPLRDSDVHFWHLARLGRALFYYRPMFRRAGIGGPEAVCVELGADAGMASLAWRDLFGRYIGIEAFAGRVDEAKAYQHRVGVGSELQFHSGLAVEVCRNRRAFGIPPRIDTLVLNGILAHLTIAERREVLRLADEVVAGGGTVVVTATPNRLCRYDADVWQGNFMSWLPPDLLRDYAAQCPNEELRRILPKADRRDAEHLIYRAGRGTSFHEFELYWFGDQLASAPIVADGYAPEMLNHVPLHTDEVDLIEGFIWNSVPAPKGFTRYWLDMIFDNRKPRVPSARVRHVGPFETTLSSLAWKRRRHWEIDEVAMGGTAVESSTIPLELDIWEPSARRVSIQFDLERSFGSFLVEDRQKNVLAQIDVDPLRYARVPTWHNCAVAGIDLPVIGANRLSIRPADPWSQLVFQSAMVESDVVAA